MPNDTIVLGAVAYDPKVVTIWDGFKRYFANHGVSFDYVLYSNYERQVEALLNGQIDVAWNSPLAWIRAQRLAKARGVEVSTFCMRDTDRDNRSVIAVRADTGISTIAIAPPTVRVTTTPTTTRRDSRCRSSTQTTPRCRCRPGPARRTTSVAFAAKQCSRFRSPPLAPIS